MRVLSIPARMSLLMGTLLMAVPTAWSQGLPEERTVKVAGRVLGETQIEKTDSLVIMLLAGWSESLSTDIAAGMGPPVALRSGRVESIVTRRDATHEGAQWTGSFEFKDIPPGEYQAVAVRLKEGAESGVAVAEGARLRVEDRDIADLELAITALPSDQPGKRHGGAENREATLIENIGRPRITPAPVFNPRPRIVTSRPYPSGGKKGVLANVIVGLSIAASVFVFMRMNK